MSDTATSDKVISPVEATARTLRINDTVTAIATVQSPNYIAFVTSTGTLIELYSNSMVHSAGAGPLLIRDHGAVSWLSNTTGPHAVAAIVRVMGRYVHKK